MAGWVTRGYVQDSEEEEEGLSDKSESQKDGRRAAASAEDLAHLEEHAHLGSDNEARAESVKKPEQNQQEVAFYESLASQNASLEGHDSQGTFWDLPSSFQATDELQQGHYGTLPGTPPDTTALRTTCTEGMPQRQDVLSSQATSSATLSLFPTESHTGATEISTKATQQSSCVSPPRSEICQRTRALRQRNPIQLHPYAIENEKYRQTLAGRGLKPLRIAQLESQKERERQGDSQGDDFLADLESQDGHFQSGPLQADYPMMGSQDSSSSVPRPVLPAHVFQGDGDLPDLEVILRSEPARVAVNGHKRRRVMPSISRNHGQAQTLTDQRAGSNVQASVQMADTMNMPPSPPQSQTPESHGATRPGSRGFRIPRGLSPVALPTPFASSESRNPRRQISRAFATDNHTSAPRGSGSESETSTNPNQEYSHRQLERVQRKIRGVLPASWLRLDLKSRNNKPSKSTLLHPTSSPEKDVMPERGVARPVISRKTANLASSSILNVTDSSTENDSDPETGVRLQSLTSSLTSPMLPVFTVSSDEEDLPLPHDVWGEAAEDDRVDAMLPPRSRKEGARRPYRTSKLKKRQIRLTDMHQGRAEAITRPLQYAPRNRKGQQLANVPNFAKPRKPKFRPPDLSLLDVPALSEDINGRAPSFIRLARRTSRSRQDRGISRPERKYLCMTTELDTEDVNASLRSWREGTLKLAEEKQKLGSTLPLNSRSPLRSCTGNQQRMQNRSATLERTLMPLAKVTPTPRPENRVAKRRKSRSIQSTLSNIIRMATTTSKHGRTKSRESEGRPGIRAKEQRLEWQTRPSHLLSSLEKPGHPRPAALEFFQARNDQNDVGNSIHRPLDAGMHRHLLTVAPNPLLSRFLGDTNVLQGRTQDSRAPPSDTISAVKAQEVLVIPRPRKRRPRQVLSHALRSLDADEPLYSLQNHLGRSLDSTSSVRQSNKLVGLAALQDNYTVSLGVVNLPIGTCFGERTFLGSGDLDRSLNIRDLDQPRGFHVFQFGSETCRWGPWDNNVSTQLGAIVDEICESFNRLPHQCHQRPECTFERIVNLLRDVVQYITDNLNFHDTIDRADFLQHSKCLILRLFQAMHEESGNETPIDMHQDEQSLVQAMTLCFVLLAQLLRISKHVVVPLTTQLDIKSSLQDMTARTMNHMFKNGHDHISQCYSRLKQSKGHPITLQEDQSHVEALVIASHVLEDDDSISGFWQAVQSNVLPHFALQGKDAKILEACWVRLFLILAFLEFDRRGVLDPDRRRKTSIQHWTMVKSLLEPVFDAYEEKTHSQHAAINSYCRTLFGRCFRLIELWSWRRCESIIGVLFDFFARRRLSHLPHEEAHGSPHFLSQLDQEPLLQVESEDRCFHILLKIIASGLQQMQKSYPGKRIRDIVWRLMPNHGRFLPKDQAIQQTDLDALRNHHDLLCTLYWASPSGFRPKATVIQSLVEVENSHKEACRINIRAWSNLVRFQLITGESLKDLEPFGNWWNHLLGQLVQQHQNARVEAEEQARLAESAEGILVSRSLVESTIGQNQRQVEAMLIDALLSMKNAINISPDVERAGLLLSPDLSLVFNLFDPSSSSASKVVLHALEVLLAFIGKAMPSDQTKHITDNDDSQDYGDWTGFGSDIAPAAANPAAALHLEAHFLSPLRQLLSNCFGADASPDDALLTKVVDAWVAVGCSLVRAGLRTWNSYIGDFGQDSWASLRGTEQTRRYLAYYIAVVVENDAMIFEEHRQPILKAWVTLIVERELFLKYQHRLTSALLNAKPDDPILANPPFWSVNGRFQITSAELSGRRLAVISNMLSNIRTSVEHGQARTAADSASLRSDHKDILRAMMNAMKSNYRELGQGSEIRGAYVDLVHRVVELLQQHTSTICPVDRFFTDSSSFPLPATDPTYVVGQLKNYGMRLHDPKAPKQLAVFIQSISERAAVDGQQLYFVDQLHSAMTSDSSGEDTKGLHLRSFIMTAVFPAYIESALSTACGWVFVLPILQASGLVFSWIMADINGIDKKSVKSTYTVFGCIVGSLRTSFNVLLENPGTMEQPETLKVLAAYFAVITTMLPALDYLCRLMDGIHDARASMASFRQLAIFTARKLLGETEIDAPHGYDMKESLETTRHADVRAFTLQELQETLTKHWIRHDDTYYLSRGRTRKEVVVDVGLLEEEKAGCIKEIEGFINALDRMTVLGSRVSDGF